MILSNLEIQKALDEGRLILDPEPQPRTPEHGSTYCPYNGHSLDLRLYNQVKRPIGGPFNYDLMESGSLPNLIAAHSEDYTLTERQPYQLKTGEFILGRTLEWVELPTKQTPYLAARIEGKSSRARCGVLVHFTAPTVHPGWRGSLTLEMINLGPTTFILRPEMPIPQLIVEQVHGDVLLTPGQFNNQSTPEGL